MTASSNGGGEVHLTAADLSDLSERLDVIADDIVILTRERDEAQAEVARLTAAIEPLARSESGRLRREHDLLRREVADMVDGTDAAEHHHGDEANPDCAACWREALRSVLVRTRVAVHQ